MKPVIGKSHSSTEVFSYDVTLSDKDIMTIQVIMGQHTIKQTLFFKHTETVRVLSRRERWVIFPILLIEDPEPVWHDETTTYYTDIVTLDIVRRGEKWLNKEDS